MLYASSLLRRPADKPCLFYFKIEAFRVRPQDVVPPDAHALDATKPSTGTSRKTPDSSAGSLSAVLGDPKTDGRTRHRIGYVMCDLSNGRGRDDLPPKLFPALPRLYVRAAREAIRDGSPMARLLR